MGLTFYCASPAYTPHKDCFLPRSSWKHQMLLLLMSICRRNPENQNAFEVGSFYWQNVWRANLILDKIWPFSVSTTLTSISRRCCLRSRRAMVHTVLENVFWKWIGLFTRLSVASIWTCQSNPLLSTNQQTSSARVGQPSVNNAFLESECLEDQWQQLLGQSEEVNARTIHTYFYTYTQ